MKPYNELVKSKIYHLTKLQNKLYGEVEDYLRKNKLSKTDFAKELNVSKGYVSQILNGGFDHKLSKLFELSLAINKIPNIEFVELEEFKRIKLTDRFENIPLNLSTLNVVYKAKEDCYLPTKQKEIYTQEPLLKLSF